MKTFIQILLLVIVASFLFIYGLGGPSLFETDEYIYTQISKNIIQTGDFLTLHFQGKPWFIHPPFYMWLTSIAIDFLGASEFSARIWCALFGILGVLITYLLGRELFTKRIGFIAGIILATTFQYIVQSRIAIFDVPLVAFMLLSVYFFHLGRTRNWQGYYYLFFACLGLGVLMKGPVGFVLPMLVIAPYLIFSGEYFLFKQIDWLKGLLIFLVISSTWYIIESIIHGRSFIDSVIGFYTIGRYLMPIETHAAPWYFYFIVLAVGFMPWTAFIPGIFAKLFREREDKQNLFVLLWLVIVFVFFSIARTKLPGYIMSMYPFLAIALAKFFDDYIANPKDRAASRWMFYSFLLLFLISLLLVILPFVISSSNLVIGYEKLLTGVLPLLLVFGAGGLISSLLFIFMERKVPTPVLILVISSIVSTFFLVNSLMPAIEEYKPMRPLSQKLLSVIKPGEPVLGYKILYRTGFSYYYGKEIKWIDTQRQLVGYLKSRQRVFCFIPEEEYEKLREAVRYISYIIDKKAGILLISNQE